MCALPCLVSLHLRSEIGQGEHHLLQRIIEQSLAIVGIEEDTHARVSNLLEHVARLDLLAAQPRLLGHDKDLERRAWFKRVQQASEARAGSAEERATDSVILIDVFIA